MRKAGLLTTLKSKLKKVRSNFMWRLDDVVIFLLSAAGIVLACELTYSLAWNYFIIYVR